MRFFSFIGLIVALAAWCGWRAGLVALGIAPVVLAGELGFSNGRLLGEILEKVVIIVAVAADGRYAINRKPIDGRSVEVLTAELVAAGSAVLVSGPDGAAPDGAVGIATGEVTGGLASAVEIVPVQLLSWALARRRGLAPGTYTIASKVTTHE